jgi:hypothetical protein
VLVVAIAAAGYAGYLHRHAPGLLARLAPGRPRAPGPARQRPSP